VAQVVEPSTAKKKGVVGEPLAKKKTKKTKK
jgi:hypothetical protein